MLLSESRFQSVLNAVLTDTQIQTDNEKLTKLFSAGGIERNAMDNLY